MQRTPIYFDCSRVAHDVHLITGSGKMHVFTDEARTGLSQLLNYLYILQKRNVFQPAGAESVST